MKIRTLYVGCSRVNAIYAFKRDYMIVACLYKNSSGDEIENVNFTCTGQRLRPLHDFLISTKHLHYITYPSNRVLTWTHPSNRLCSTVDWTCPLLQETHQEEWV